MSDAAGLTGMASTAASAAAAAAAAAIPASVLAAALPKERMTAWQRWEMDSLCEPAPEDPASPASLTPEQQAAAQQLRLALDEARATGRDEGHAEGLELGRQAGYQQGIEQAQLQCEQLQALLQGLSAELGRAHEAVSEALLDLSLDLAKAMLKSALAVNPSLVLPVVQHAIKDLPMVQQPAHIALHPDDAQLVRSQMQPLLAEAGWTVRDDASVQRGGCLLDTAANHVDASVASRWQRIAAALGKQGDWLA